MNYSIDSRGVLVDALKMDNDLFQLTNLILPSKASLKAVYQLESIRADMLEFAKNPEVGINMLGQPPKKPDTTNMTQDQLDQAEYEFMEMEKMYEQEKLALTMHVPYADMIMINNFLAKFVKTLHATAAIKGNRFYAFTKQITEQEQGALDFLKKAG